MVLCNRLAIGTELGSGIKVDVRLTSSFVFLCLADRHTRSCLTPLFPPKCQETRDNKRGVDMLRPHKATLPKCRRGARSHVLLPPAGAQQDPAMWVVHERVLFCCFINKTTSSSFTSLCHKCNWLKLESTSLYANWKSLRLKRITE